MPGFVTFWLFLHMTSPLGSRAVDPKVRNEVESALSPFQETLIVRKGTNDFDFWQVTTPARASASFYPSDD